MLKSPIQRILFGSPGTGKSFRVKTVIAPALGIAVNSDNYIPTVFHPEYTYGDFMGKLMPFTNDSGKVEYLFYRGHFLKALAQAYKNIILTYLEQDDQRDKATDDYKREIGKTNLRNFTLDETNENEKRKNNIQRKLPKNVLLVIDEINRGNSAAIFGTVFQLLDRETNGWSAYGIAISDLEFKGLLQEMSFKHLSYIKENKLQEEYEFNNKAVSKDRYEEYQSLIFEAIDEQNLAKERKIKISPNLSILATMNTSDNSIYFMDNAFKRRWDWEFINIEEDGEREVLQHRFIQRKGKEAIKWVDFVDNLNEFIRSKYKTIRKIEDKQIGYFFINEIAITEAHIKNKLMFFVWDSVFNTNRQPLTELLGMKEEELVTFGQFTQQKVIDNFILKIKNYNV